MEQREKLIELIGASATVKITQDADGKIVGGEIFNLCEVADYLIAHGVLVLPCKVGDTVYQVGKDLCEKRSYDKCDAYCDGWDDLCPENNGEWEIQTGGFTVGLFDLVGESIYITREEAERALARRKGGD